MPIRKSVVVIAHTHQPIVALHRIFFQVRFDGLNQFVHTVNVASWRCVKTWEKTAEHHVAVSIDKPWCHRFAFQIDTHHFRRSLRLDLCKRANSLDCFTLHQQRFRQWLRIIHSNDGSVVIQCLRHENGLLLKIDR